MSDLRLPTASAATPTRYLAIIRLSAHNARYDRQLRHQSQKSRQLTMQVVISPQSLLETGIRVEKVDDLRLFKFTDDLQDKLEELIAKNQSATLTHTEQEELTSISELDSP
jgi:hypothetical protein